MDWMIRYTGNLSLKKSFLIYSLVGLLISQVFSGFTGSVLYGLRKDFILKRIRATHFSFYEEIILSEGFGIFMDIIPFLITLLFLIIFFSFFYSHKIKPSINLLNMNPEDERDNLKRKFYQFQNMDELSEAVVNFKENSEKLESENFRNILIINEISRKTDTLSHELKNPLAVIKGDLEILKIISEENEEVGSEIGIVLNRLIRNEKRIEDCLNVLGRKDDVQRIVPQISDVPAGVLISEIKRDINSWLTGFPPDKKIIFQNENMDDGITSFENIMKYVPVDMVLLKEGILNILKNASYFAVRQINVDFIPENEILIIRIKDDGPGFSEDSLKNYNKAYFSENLLSGNMGLGLYITDIIMKKQGIKMAVSNNNGGIVDLYLRFS